MALTNLKDAVNQAINDFDEIKDEIEANGVRVDNAPTRDYAEKISEIPAFIYPRAVVSAKATEPININDLVTVDEDTVKEVEGMYWGYNADYLGTFYSTMYSGYSDKPNSAYVHPCVRPKLYKVNPILLYSKTQVTDAQAEANSVQATMSVLLQKDDGSFDASCHNTKDYKIVLKTSCYTNYPNLSTNASRYYYTFKTGVQYNDVDYVMTYDKKYLAFYTLDEENKLYKASTRIDIGTYITNYINEDAEFGTDQECFSCSCDVIFDGQHAYATDEDGLLIVVYALCKKPDDTHYSNAQFILVVDPSTSTIVDGLKLMQTEYALNITTSYVAPVQSSTGAQVSVQDAITKDLYLFKYNTSNTWDSELDDTNKSVAKSGMFLVPSDWRISKTCYLSSNASNPIDYSSSFGQTMLASNGVIFSLGRTSGTTTYENFTLYYHNCTFDGTTFSIGSRISTTKQVPYTTMTNAIHAAGYTDVVKPQYGYSVLHNDGIVFVDKQGLAHQVSKIIVEDPTTKHNIATMFEWIVDPANINTNNMSFKIDVGNLTEGTDGSTSNNIALLYARGTDKDYMIMYMYYTSSTSSQYTTICYSAESRNVSLVKDINNCKHIGMANNTADTGDLVTVNVWTDINPE